ncbi:hypothetical protein LG3211_0397 [Lysobacter gummosus]|nr:hypothetical protein LG3211_0397 [Lysobacter gummosus]
MVLPLRDHCRHGATPVGMGTAPNERVPGPRPCGAVLYLTIKFFQCISFA